MTAFAGNATGSNIEMINSVMASQNRIFINLHIGYDNPIERHKGIGRIPMQSPSVYICGHTIFLNGCIFEKMQLITTNENGEDNIIYSLTIPEGIDSIEIPIDFTGEYEIRLYREDYFFYGLIEM